MTGLPSVHARGHIHAMAKSPDRPRTPAKQSKRAPARATRAKVARPESAASNRVLDDLLNPGIQKGTAGIGSGTGLQPPPDNSFERRADFAAAHKARKSTAKGFGEAPQAGFVARVRASPGELDPDLAKALGIEEEDDSLLPSPLPESRSPSFSPPPLRGRSASEASREGGKSKITGQASIPLPNPPPSQVGPARLAHENTEPGQAQVPGGREQSEQGGRQKKVALPRPVETGITGASASMQALENLLREGRREFIGPDGSQQVWTPHRPPRPEKRSEERRVGKECRL